MKFAASLFAGIAASLWFPFAAAVVSEPIDLANFYDGEAFILQTEAPSWQGKSCLAFPIAILNEHHVLKYHTPQGTMCEFFPDARGFSQQHFYHTDTQQISVNEWCWGASFKCLVDDPSNGNHLVKYADCDESVGQKWTSPEPGMLRSGNGRCLFAKIDHSGKKFAFLSTCDDTSPLQMWNAVTMTNPPTTAPGDCVDIFNGSCEEAFRGRCYEPLVTELCKHFCNACPPTTPPPAPPSSAPVTPPALPEYPPISFDEGEDVTDCMDIYVGDCGADYQDCSDEVAQAVCPETCGVCSPTISINLDLGTTDVYIPPPPPMMGEQSDALTASSSGDPHFKTWGGSKYDFHGGCDLVLVQNPVFADGMGLNIHIRTKIDSWWSYIESAVVQIGKDTLEVTGGENGGTHWINGKPGEELKDGESLVLSGFKAAFRQVSHKQKRFRIDFRNGGDGVSIETYKDFVRVNVRAKNANNFKGAAGLMGSYPSGAMMARDGKTVLKDPNEFGLEWQVLASEPMLFHALGAVQPPMQCGMPDKTTKNLRRRLEGSLIREEDAAVACSHVGLDEKDACIFDVLATNDKDMAGAY